MTVSERLAEALGSSAFLGSPAQPALQPQPYAEQGLSVGQGPSTMVLHFCLGKPHSVQVCTSIMHY